MTAPSLLVIAGAQKAGTKSLFEYLGQHSAIAPTAPRETRIFSSGSPTLDDVLATVPNGSGAQWLLESTPSYLVAGEPVIERMLAVDARARVLVAVRDPVDRFVSHYRMKVRTAVWEEPPSLERIVAMPEDAADQRIASLWRNGRYADHLPSWVRSFWPERLRVVFLHDLQRDPLGVVSGLLDWLELPTDEAEAFDLGVRNKAFGIRSGPLTAMARRVHRSVEPALSRAPRFSRAVAAAYHRVNSTAVVESSDAAGPELRAAIAERYREPNRRFAELLRDLGHDDLPTWLRDDVPAPREEAS